MASPDTSQLTLFRMAAEKLGLDFSILGAFTAEAGFGKTKKRTVFRVSNGNESIFFLGATSMHTSYIGMKMAVDKVFAKNYMAENGIPTTFQKEIGSKEDLAAFLEENGRIILKPSASRAGHGIFSNITKLSEAFIALKTIQEELKKKAVAEKVVDGNEYRVLVANGKLVAVAEYLPPFVIGDGVRSIQELIERQNRDRMKKSSPLKPIPVNEALSINLSVQGRSLESIPAKGEGIILHKAAPISSGGMTRNVTEKIHPENIALALKIAGLFHLDIAGIDFIIDDIANPLTRENGAILEINGGPDLSVHYSVHEGTPINPAEVILREYFKLA